jgi:hypothetical protein
MDFVNLIKKTGRLLMLSKDSVRVEERTGELLVRHHGKPEQYMLLGDEDGIKELKKHENLPEIKQDYLI